MTRRATPVSRVSKKATSERYRGGGIRTDSAAALSAVLNSLPTHQLKKVLQKTYRRDGWVSALTGAGTVRDKKQYSSFVAPHTNWRENIDLWRGDDLAGRVVELLPNEMMREGWELCVEDNDSQDIVKRVTALLEDLQFSDHLRQGLCLERAVGGGGVVMGVSDLSEDMSQPLDLKRVSSLSWMETFEPIELQAATWQNDPSLPGFGRPDVYRLQPVSPGGAKKGQGHLIHSSRILKFPGIIVSRRQITSQMGWGDAVLTRCRDTIRDFQNAWGSVGTLIAEYGVPVWKIKNLAEIISLDKDEELKTRIEMMQLAMSLVNAVIIDGEQEEYERKQVPLTGLSDIMQAFGTRLAASSDTPVTLLFGISPGGLNSNGAFDTRSWYDRVHSAQDQKLKHPIEQAVKVAYRALGIDEPKSWYIKFKPLWQPTEQEEAATRLTQMQIDTGYVNLDVLARSEIRKARFTGRAFSYVTQVTGDLPISPEPSAGTSPSTYAAVKARTMGGPRAAAAGY